MVGMSYREGNLNDSGACFTRFNKLNKMAFNFLYVYPMIDLDLICLNEENQEFVRVSVSPLRNIIDLVREA